MIQGGVLQPGYFMDITGKVEDGGERGLLGLAFDPHFKTNHRLFVYYTRNGGDIVVSRFTTNAARTDVIESTARPLLLIEHSAQSNHNGGAMAFGPNGLLYIGVGDGGGGGDPRNNAQNKGRLLGKILRINVNGTGHGPFGHYSVPRSNPFYGSKPGSRGDLGLRRAQPVADLVRPRHGQAVHRGRRAEPLRGDRPREGRLHGRPQLRLERDGGDALLHGLEVPARRRHAAQR